MSKFFIVLCFIIHQAQAAPTENIYHKYYDIYPWNGKDLTVEILNKSPIFQDGKKYMASTNWDVYWSFNLEIKDGICNLADVQVDYRVIITIPQIYEHSIIDDNVIIAFNNIIEKLLTNEYQNINKGRTAALEVENLLHIFEPRKNCDSLQIAANKAADNIVKRYSKSDFFIKKQSEK